METFLKKLDTRNRPVTFTELEEQIGKHIMSYEVHLFDYVGCYYEPWDFQLAMSEKDVIDAIREAYLNAGKRSKRISLNKIGQVDCENLGRILEVDCYPIKNFECLYQGRAGGLVIRFLFDYKDMKIVMAYPVLKEARLPSGYQEYQFYSKGGHYFTYGSFSGKHPLSWKGRK